MQYTYQRAGVWSMVVFLAILLFSMLMAGFIPPPSPGLSAEQIVAHARDHAFGVKLCAMLGEIGIIFLAPFSVVLAIQLARIEGGRYPMVAMTSLCAGVGNMVAICLIFVFWSGTFYRLDRDPELILLMHDTAWLDFVMFFAPFAFQVVCVAIVGFSDKSAMPTFPRWFCFFSLWVALLIAPGGLAIFFQSGPFAWNGLLAFWVPVSVFFVYLVCMIALLLKAITRQQQEEAAGLPAASA